MHRRPTAAFALACALLAVLSACQSADPHIVVRGHEIRPRTYSLVLWRRNDGAGRLLPMAETGETAESDARIEYAERLEDLRDAGILVLAGPFGPAKHDRSLEGLWVVESGASFDARALVDADPAVRWQEKEGEVLPLLTLDILRFLPELGGMDRTPGVRMQVNGQIMEPRPVLRAYCAVLAEDGERVSRLLDGDVLGPKVALMGRLGGERDGTLFAILDVEGPEVARPYLIAASGGRDVPGVELSQVFLTPALHTLLVEGPPPAQ
ncbi:MAG: hypothetical protein AAFP22_21865 [Planctomycetota bacterium]